MSFKHRGLARLALLAASTFAALAVAELVLSLFGPAWLRSGSKALEEQLAESEAALPDPAHGDSLKGLIRASKNPRLIYELKPGLKVLFRSAPVTINRHGYRGRAYPKDKPDGVIRILGLGDSNMFGYGMADNQTFLHLLERSLNARSAGKRYQVLNFAVPGYNTMQEAEQLESVGIQYRPDMILILFVPNDAMLPNFVRRKKGSGLMPFTRVDELMNEGAALFGTEAERDQLEFWNDPSRVPPEYASMVGKGAVREGLRRISYLAGTHGFQVFLFCLIKGQPLQAEVVRWCPELGIRFLDLDEYMAENGLRHGPELWISEEDPHPNAAFHRAIADFLSQALTRP